MCARSERSHRVCCSLVLFVLCCLGSWRSISLAGGFVVYSSGAGDRIYYPFFRLCVFWCFVTLVGYWYHRKSSLVLSWTRYDVWCQDYAWDISVATVECLCTCRATEGSIIGLEPQISRLSHIRCCSAEHRIQECEVTSRRMVPATRVRMATEPKRIIIQNMHIYQVGPVKV